ncbi:MAG: DUF2520 domain-containing protein [Bacteroidota bacterium]
MRIALIGNGNLAWHLSNAVRNAGSRIDLHLVTANNTNSPWQTTQEINEIVMGRFHLVLLAVPDHQISHISERLPDSSSVIHFSGATSLSALKQTNRAVCWPCQTFSKGTNLDYKKIPILYEASTLEMKTYLEAVLMPVWGTWMVANTEQRQLAHLAAVFSNNFSNYMQTVSQALLQRAGLSEQILLPMLQAQVNLLETNRAEKIQTGPAKRHDMNTLQQHELLLQYQSEWRDLYTRLSHLISDHYSQANEL